MTTYRQPGTIVTDRTFAVPLDHGRPDGEQIEIFARQIVATGKADANLPWLVFLQGGPGGAAPRPVSRDGWLNRALDDYQVLLLDQRGTGRSTPANRQTLARLSSPQAQADYLTHFRADSIVLDAELIRRDVTGGAPWTVLGQSYGGFCAVTYLSYAPHGIREALITGGLPGLTATADDVYRRTYPQVVKKNTQHYERYPHDVDNACRIAAYLDTHEVRLPGGQPLTVAAFQSLGGMLGSGSGSHTLHYLLENAFTPDGDELADAFRFQIAQDLFPFATSPLYALLHEACYAQGTATRWSAQRILREFPEFDPAAAIDGTGPLLFTGEMIYPWMVDSDPLLSPLRDAATILAERDDWPSLYDPARLGANEVPAAAAVYYDDMYVPAEFSLATAARIRGLRPWITNEYEHDGLRVSGGKVLGRLIAMARGTL
jgi:pimeloyl-ACP methyl ester carboxylesterase